MCTMCSVLQPLPAHRRPLDSSPPAQHPSSSSSSASSDDRTCEDSWSPFHVLCAVAATSPTTGGSDTRAMNETSATSSRRSHGSPPPPPAPSSCAASCRTMAVCGPATGSTTSRKKRILERCVSEAGCGSRQDEEALAASALLDLAFAATAVPAPTCGPEASPMASAAATVYQTLVKVEPSPLPDAQLSNQTSVITTNPNVQSCAWSSAGRPASRPLIPKSEALPSEPVQFLVTHEVQGQRLLHLLQRPDLLIPVPGHEEGRMDPWAGRQDAVIDLSTKKHKRTKGAEVDGEADGIRSREQEQQCLLPDDNNNDTRLVDRMRMAGRLDQENRQSMIHFPSHVLTPVLPDQRTSQTCSFMPPNVLHFLPSSDNTCDQSSSTMSGLSRNFCGSSSSSSSSSSCSSVDGSESCCSSSPFPSCGLAVVRKRGRKRLFHGDQGTGSDSFRSRDGSSGDHNHSSCDNDGQNSGSGNNNINNNGGGTFSNPIKEFRQRQRVRERQEDERLAQLEARYRNAQLLSSMSCVPGQQPHQQPQPDLDEVYDMHGMNMKFPRVKTALKRGKAADDCERSNRKKECARRDSKNYRERAKAKRDLILRKISFLEDLFKSASATAAPAPHTVSHFHYTSF